jgi:hypothetical protein
VDLVEIAIVPAGDASPCASGILIALEIATDQERAAS